ncbi:MAG: MFS transporter [Planctomycetota bacterium]
MPAPHPHPVTPSTPPAATPWVVSRLSAMMILEYASLGLWIVTVGAFLSANTGAAGSGMFSAGFIGLAATSQALGSLFAPVLVGVAADRFFRSERLLAGLHAVCVGCLWLMCTAPTQAAFYAALLVYFQAYAPTGTLANSLSLRHLPEAEHTFALVRSLGTVGWIAAGVAVGYLWPALFGRGIEATLVPLKLAAVTHAVTALYCLTLPETRPLQRGGVGWRLLAGSGHLLRDRGFLVFLAISLLMTAPSQFYNSFVNPFLNQTGFGHPAAKLTLGQAAEVGCLLLLPALMARFGLRRLLLVGGAAWGVRFAMLAAYGYTGLWIAYPAILLHGVSFVFVYIAGQLYADRVASRDARAAAQGLYMLATGGLGHLLGSILGQYSQAALLTPEGVDPAPYRWGAFWLIPCGCSLLACVLAAAFFREAARKRS